MPGYYRLYDLGLALLLAGYSSGFLAFLSDFHYYSGEVDVAYVAVRLAVLSGAVVILLVTVVYWRWIVPEVLALRKK
jgi:hypothetical protein